MSGSSFPDSIFMGRFAEGSIPRHLAPALTAVGPMAKVCVPRGESLAVGNWKIMRI